MGLAFYNVLGAIGGFVSPYIVGRLSNGGSYNSSMYLQGAFNLAAALMVLGAQRPCMAHLLDAHGILGVLRVVVLLEVLFACAMLIGALHLCGGPCACPHRETISCLLP